jgi:Flp pilus assembly protein TadB
MDRDASADNLQWGDRWLVSHVPLAFALVLVAAALTATVGPAPWLKVFAISSGFLGVMMSLAFRSAIRRVRRAENGPA